MSPAASPIYRLARRRLIGPAIAFLAPLCAPAAADALQIAGNSTDPVNTEVLECASCTVTLTWTIVNTGVPQNAVATLGNMMEVVAPLIRTDYTNDVVQAGATTQGMAGQCGTTLGATSRCTVQATFNIRDADPFDQVSAVNDVGRFVVGIDFAWRVPTPNGGREEGSTYLPLEITVRDDATPEPAAWGLLVLGLGLAGAALRRRPREAGA